MSALLEAGARGEREGTDGLTPLDKAAELGFPEIAQAVL